MDKLLTYLMQAAEGNKRRIKNLFSNPSDETNALLNRGVENTQAHLNKLTGKPYNQVNDDAYKQAMEDVAFQAMFIGPNAKTWNKMMNDKALHMERQGIDPRRIWKETGNWKAPDGMWRQEIPDNASTWSSDVEGNVAKHIQNNQGEPISKSFIHETLYQSYPDAKNIKLFQNTTGNGGGTYDQSVPKITLNTVTDYASPSSRIGSTAIHELQHAVQKKEGFASGGTPELMKKIGKQAIDEYDLLWQTMKNNPKNSGAIIPELDLLRAKYRDFSNPQEAYKRLAGEAEARATQTRIPLTAEERRFVYPADSYDMPMEKLIVLLGGENVMKTAKQQTPLVNALRKK